MKLPRRTRTHILEDLSVRKLESLLPDAWIYRIPSHDYGIDGEVEIIDTEGYTTGKKFLVQLKATDEENETKALKLRMKNSSLNYFNQLNVPILIVRYLAKSDTIYTRWHYSLNPNDDSRAEKSFCMVFQEKDKWDDARASQIIDDIEAYQSIKQQVLAKPFPVSLNIESTTALSKYTAQFVAKLIVSSKKSRSLFSFSLVSKGDGKATSLIEISDNEIYINLAGVGSFRANFQPLTCVADLDSLISDIYVALAFILQNLSHLKEAEEIYDDYLNNSNFKDKDHIFFSYISTKIQLNNIPDALKYIVEIDTKHGNDKGEFDFALLGLSLIMSQTPEEDMDSVISVYYELIENTDNPLVLSTYYYNIGVCLRKRDQNRESIKHYLKAAKINSDYKLRPYWNRELAGLFFMIGKYTLSSNFYANSLQGDDNTPEHNILYADSLMLSGKYKKSLSVLEKYASELEIRNSEWCLKNICLQYIIGQYGIEEQTKKGEAGRELIENSTEDEVIEFLKQKNALCPDAQFFIGTKLAEREELEEACYCFLISAFSDERYHPSWLQAMGCAFQINDLNLFFSILETASRKRGIEIISEFMDGFPSSDNSMLNEFALGLIQHCEEYLSTFQDSQFELRLGDSKSPNSLVLNRNK
ncbi:DUF4365 domain-containing protein [Vibrio lentus]